MLFLRWLSLFRGAGRGWADKVPSYAGRGVDDAAAAEGDVLGSVQLGAAGDFVAGFGFDPVGFLGFGGAGCRWGRHCWDGVEVDGEGREGGGCGGFMRGMAVRALMLGAL